MKKIAYLIGSKTLLVMCLVPWAFIAYIIGHLINTDKTNLAIIESVLLFVQIFAGVLKFKYFKYD